MLNASELINPSVSSVLMFSSGISSGTSSSNQGRTFFTNFQDTKYRVVFIRSLLKRASYMFVNSSISLFHFTSLNKNYKMLIPYIWSYHSNCRVFPIHFCQCWFLCRTQHHWPVHTTRNWATVSFCSIVNNWLFIWIFCKDLTRTLVTDSDRFDW